eukprot:5454944-Pyramimonas_sp.AAC.1
MYRVFCQHAADQLGRTPGGPAATPVRAGQQPVAGGGELAQQASTEQQPGVGSGQALPRSSRARQTAFSGFQSNL